MHRKHNVGAELLIETAAFALPARKQLTELIEGIYKEHYRELFIHLILSGCSPADAEEYLQEGFLRLVGALREGKSVTSPKNWLLRVLHNIRFDERVKTSRFVALDLNDPDEQLGRSARIDATPES